MLHHLKDDDQTLSVWPEKGSVSSVVWTPICEGFVVFNILSYPRTLNKIWWHALCFIIHTASYYKSKCLRMQKQLILLIYLDEVLADTQRSVSISLLEEISKSDVSNSLLTGGL